MASSDYSGGVDPGGWHLRGLHVFLQLLQLQLEDGHDQWSRELNGEIRRKFPGRVRGSGHRDKGGWIARLVSIKLEK